MTKSWQEFIFEMENAKYDFSSVQFNLPQKERDKVLEWSEENVPDEVLHDPPDENKGREDEPHVTVLYGLHDPDPAPVKDFLKRDRPFEIVLGKLSLFDTNEKFDVLKIDVEGKKLHNINRRLRGNFKHWTSYPKYIPHVTIAYLKKGKGEEWAGDDVFEGMKIDVNTLLFSSTKKTKTPIPLNG